jgi:hypothetical protein
MFSTAAFCFMASRAWVSSASSFFALTGLGKLRALAYRPSPAIAANKTIPHTKI